LYSPQQVRIQIATHAFASLLRKNSANFNELVARKKIEWDERKIASRLSSPLFYEFKHTRSWALR
jgi:hypothetical protein